MKEKVYMFSTIFLAPVWFYITIQQISEKYADLSPIGWIMPLISYLTLIHFFMTFYFILKYIDIPVIHTKKAKRIFMLTIISIIIEIISFCSTNSSFSYNYYDEMRDLLTLVCGTGIVGALLFFQFNTKKTTI